MMWQNHQLDNTVLKTSEAITLWKADKGIVEISENALAVPIKLGDQRKGYVFHGHGKLLLDTIVETEGGAIGRPVEKEIDEPFLMLGGTEEIQKRLSTVSAEDFAEMGYGNPQEFAARAEDLCDRFFENRRICSCQCFGEEYGSIFAFHNKASKFDILVAKGSKLVYKAMSMVFVSNENIVLKSPGEVVLSHNRKSFVIRK